MPPDLASSLVAQLATLTFVAGGLALVVAGSSPGGRRFAWRMLSVGVLLAVVAGLIAPEWLP